jgi:hypothetical protein
MYLKDSLNQNIPEVLKELNPGADEALMLLIGEEDQGIDLPKLISDLNDAGAVFFGGLFPTVIYGKEMSKSGAVVAKLPLNGKPLVIGGLDRETIDLAAVDYYKQCSPRQCTAVVFVDGLAENINGFLSGLYNKMADAVSYIGGGAGSLSFEQKPCLFTNEGLFQDAAVITMLNVGSKLGVYHGWNNLAGPLVATKTVRNTIYELNWHNAFDAYRKIVEADCGDSLHRENFFDIAKGYPFGMIKDYAERIVRDPIAVGPQGELICVGAVPENSVVDILKGDAASLIKAAGQAALESNCVPGNQIVGQLIFDCISRALYLGDAFHEELVVINGSLKKEGFAGCPFGALTLGEISSYGEGYLELFNKTVVTGVLYREHV